MLGIRSLVSLEFLNIAFLSPYILCNFVPLELQEMYGKLFLIK